MRDREKIVAFVCFGIEFNGRRKSPLLLRGLSFGFVCICVTRRSSYTSKVDLKWFDERRCALTLTQRLDLRPLDLRPILVLILIAVIMTPSKPLKIMSCTRRVSFAFKEANESQQHLLPWVHCVSSCKLPTSKDHSMICATVHPMYTSTFGA